MDHDDLQLLFELYEGTPRQGPGSPETTRRALELLPDSLRIERVLDLGCGTGGSTLVLAEETGAQITALDIHPPFLATLTAEAERRGVADRIETVTADMGDVAAVGRDFDLLWAEGSAYSIGFENALRTWRPLLRPRGCLVVSELVWFTTAPSERARAFFAEDYPDMQDEATRIEHAQRCGYEVLASFRLPTEDWLAYYAGVAPRLEAAIARHGDHPILAAARRERETYAACGDEYGYTCLVLQAV